MHYKLIVTDEYKKRLKRFFKHHPEMMDRYEKMVHILTTNPSHASLRLYKLKGNLKEYYSVSITMGYRMVIDFIIKEDTITPIDIGNYDNVYGKWGFHLLIMQISGSILL